MFTIGLQKHGAVEIDNLAVLAKEERRSHGERGADHIADHGLEAQLAGHLRHLEPFGEPATLVELDIHDSKASHKPGDIEKRLNTLIRRNGNRRIQIIHERFLPYREGLLNECNASSNQRRKESPE
jgi:hypothetical protein